ncbi:cytochrome c oxidase assembly protein [Phytoactinopolyspora halotolerans]|uniref:Cytochrome c oxidase assembly protein n=1 Tax=Phytoactinopolyspora halotolerans TaxID=1981512 RepID=A0A6L9S9G7_9ACTN|nr:cytochrome c oxidase assembly protein [Phytoactinopolyspora halotolerans]NEE02025.1 cytochrome c oxidase assembly protein [Phytoactinopolyspora halotolerans]
MHMTVLAHATTEQPAWWNTAATAGGLGAFVAAYAGGLRVLGRRGRSEKLVPEHASEQAPGQAPNQVSDPAPDQAAEHASALWRGVERHGHLRVLAFAAALAALAVALLSPLETAAETYFSAHMVQHMLLIAVAAPLLAVGAPGLPLLLSLPPRLRRAVGGRLVRWRRRPPGRAFAHALAHPVTAWFLHIGVLWAWHMPAAYDATLHSEAVHVIEHLSFVLTSWLLWWHVATPGRARMRGPVAAMYLFTVLLPSAALGAVLTLAPAPLYAEQAARTEHAGADALADQQLAGLVMWVPADVLYLLAIVGLVFAWVSGHRTATPLTATPPEVIHDASP